MSLANPCVPCCPTDPIVTNVPGATGDAGQDGAAGVGSNTTTTSPTTLPAIGANVTVTVADSSGFSYGQFVVMGDTDTGAGPATFQVVGIPTATSLTLKFLGYPADEVATTIMPTGSTLSPAGEWGLPAPLTVYGAGTAYALTNASAAVDLGTTDPVLVITAPGTYLLFTRLAIAAAGATVVAETATLKLRRTNNTAADITNESMVYDLPVMTTLTHTIGVIELQPVVYTTANSTDSLTFFGQVSATLGAGTITVTEASIVAVRIS